MLARSGHPRFRRLAGALLLIAVVAYPALSIPESPAMVPLPRAPEPLTADEEAHAQVATLVRRYNPAMVFSSGELWPVEVRYAWSDGADVIAHVRQDPAAVPRLARRNAELVSQGWADLPARDAQGRPVDYFVDAPGDGVTTGQGGWRHRWNALTHAPRLADPTKSPFPPTQYAHVFWYDRAAGLLAIQYWFYYPYNDWVNRHEADWEHVNVILSGATRLDDQARFEPARFQFFFHECMIDTPDVLRVGGADPQEDHVVVFVGGQGRVGPWGGAQSGGSYPLPGTYRRAALCNSPFSPDETVSDGGRVLPPQSFQVVLLPEPDRVDPHTRSDLGWLRLSFFAGQPHVSQNPPGVALMGHDRPPQQPGVRPDWNAGRERPRWHGTMAPPSRGIALPAGWVPRTEGPVVANLQPR